MKCIHQLFSSTLLVLVSTMLISASVQAHLMVAQHGTLNFVEDGAFMVVSLPISAFDGVDDDADGSVSMIEFNSHRAAIVETIRQKVVLSDQQVSFSLEGIMLSPVVSHDASDGTISQLTVMGRFDLVGAKQGFRFQVALFGKQPDESLLKITATRKSDQQEHIFELTPTTTIDLFY